jgi:hypothetical protein
MYVSPLSFSRYFNFETTNGIIVIIVIAIIIIIIIIVVVVVIVQTFMFQWHSLRN